MRYKGIWVFLFCLSILNVLYVKSSMFTHIFAYLNVSNILLKITFLRKLKPFICKFFFFYFQPCNLYFISIKHKVKWISLRNRGIKSCSKNILCTKQSSFLRLSWDMINSTRTCALDFWLFLGLYLYIYNIQGFIGYSI